ncbi:hypothetical protein AAV32_03835 [Kerstersia gyiorum]|uniref:Uncharacterized protein n=1 Tax=Kerstersia gyiorum TaxID=206506 RepID=A0A171KWW4_9BURK|nr:hypothetical protein AAV32_03835 [Kerstersia gyiorum]
MKKPLQDGDASFSSAFGAALNPAFGAALNSAFGSALNPSFVSAQCSPFQPTFSSASSYAQPVGFQFLVFFPGVAFGTQQGVQFHQILEWGYRLIRQVAGQ